MGLLLGCLPVSALNPSLDIGQYAHKAWAIREGFSKGVINSIAQTPDGYLWLGTEFGLLRFDGIQAVPWSPPGPHVLPGSFVNALVAARDGTLWIGTHTGLASWNGANLTRYPEFDGKIVASILEDRGGELWVGVLGTGATGRLCSIRGRQTHCYGEDGSFGIGVFSLYEDATGNLWAGDVRGLWRYKPDPPKRYASSPTEIRSIVQGDDGKLLMAMNGGVRQLVSGKLEPYPLAPASSSPYRLLRDRDGGLWIATYGQGLIHIHQGRTDVFSRADGLSSDVILSVFEDREGNIWAATTEGLDRFRELPVITISSKQGLSGDRAYSVLVARDGSVWLSGLNGLDRWKDGRVSTFRKADGLPGDLTTSLFEDDGGRLWVATAGGLARFEAGRFVTVDRAIGLDVVMTGDAEHLWVSHTARGLLHFISGRLAEDFPWRTLGSHVKASALVWDRKRGGLWLGFYGGASVVYFQDGQVRERYTHANGLGGEHVADIQLGRTDALWAATDAGLSMIRQGRIQTLSSKNGLPCDSVHWRTRADDRSVWLYMSCGLVRIAQAELDAWMADPSRTVQTTVFEPSDGVRVRPTPPGSFTPQFAKSPDGRLWFVTIAGVSVIDPAHLPFNKLPPPVHIEQIIADRKVVSDRRLPPLTRDLEIDYTALSLVSPEKNRFKYKLEGHDRDWQDAGTRRQVFYNDLPPRQYRFHVTASNNSGVWNETGDTLEFSIAPAYYQTTWFYASCVAAFLAMLWGLYRLRLYQIRREFNAQLDGRVGERMRVARELHDTLLQSFQASLIQMQAARNILDRRPENVAQRLDKAITTAADAVAEGRSAIQDLRVHPARRRRSRATADSGRPGAGTFRRGGGESTGLRRDGGRGAAGSGAAAPGRGLPDRPGIAPERVPARPGGPDRGRDPVREPPPPRAHPRRRKRNGLRSSQSRRARRTLWAGGNAGAGRAIRWQIGVLERSGCRHRSGVDRAGGGSLRRLEWRPLFVPTEKAVDP